MNQFVLHRFPDRLRLMLAFDPARLAQDLARVAGEGWIEHFVKQNYDGDWSVIPLRAQAGATHPVQMIFSNPVANDFVDTPFLDRAPYMRSVLAAFGCPLLAVRLMRLAPGSLIKEHDDNDLAFELGAVRIHVPVTTNPQVEFRLSGRVVEMKPGEAWYLRLSDPHSVANRGTTDRVHLVIDAKADAWLEDQLSRAAGACMLPSDPRG